MGWPEAVGGAIPRVALAFVNWQTRRDERKIRRIEQKLDQLVGPPMNDREAGDLVFVQGILWGWGRLYLFSKDRRAAIINTGHSMYWAGSNAIHDQPPERIRHMERWQPPEIRA